jgi:hypothetical protein
MLWKTRAAPLVGMVLCVVRPQHKIGCIVANTALCSRKPDFHAWPRDQSQGCTYSRFICYASLFFPYLQLLIPHASFLAHLSGLVAGVLWANGSLGSWALLPRGSTMWLDLKAPTTQITQRQDFVPTSPSGPLLPVSQGDLLGGSGIAPWLQGLSNGSLTR